MSGHASGARVPDDLFERARGADIEAVAGVKLRRMGARLRGECPLCRDRPMPAAVAAQAEGVRKSKRKKSGPSTRFSVDPRARVFHCFVCGAGGDVVTLEKLLRGGTLREAAERLVGAATAPRAPAAVRPAARSEPWRAEGTTPAERIAAETWREASREIMGTPAAAYLARRGIPSAIVRHLAEGWVRYHPAAKWAWDGDRGDWIRAPAMVKRLTFLDTGAVPVRAIHCTYLTADGRKAALEPAKRMWGPQKDSAGRPGGAWLTHPLGDGPLIVAEGIESALSAWALQGRPCRVVATLSLGALQGGWLTDKWGRIDPAAPAADPEKPAFVWDEPTTRPWGQVLIAVDRDMAPLRVKVRKLGGGTAEHWLDAEARARICAGLAVAAWKRAGARDVRVIAPAAGRDFNDELLSRVGV